MPSDYMQASLIKSETTFSEGRVGCQEQSALKTKYTHSQKGEQAAKVVISEDFREEKVQPQMEEQAGTKESIPVCCEFRDFIY